MAVDDDTLTDAFGSLDPQWVSDDASDPTIRYIDVRVTQLYKDFLYGKPLGVQVDQGTAGAKLRTAMTGPTGSPLVISVGPYSEAPTVQARFREASGYASVSADATGSLSNDGRLVVFDLPSVVADCPGVHTVQFRVVDSANTERLRNEFWIYVDRGLWDTDGNSPTDTGVPTTRELRNAIRDHPGANRLLGSYEFDVAELAMAVVSAVQAFNTDFPPLGVFLPTTGWPVGWRRPLIDGALAHLFSTAADYHRRGMLPYAAGNISINDLSKASEYIQASEMYRQRYIKWTKYTRMAISLRGGFGSLSAGVPTMIY